MKTALDESRFLADSEHRVVVPDELSGEPTSLVMLRNRGGAIERVPEAATAFPDRDSPWMVSVDACWDEVSRDDENVAWAREAHEAVKPYAADSVYLNVSMGDEGDDLVRETFGANSERLRRVKRRYDPENRFRMHRPVSPAE